MLFPADGEVFYNPVQEFNRDLSIAVLCHFSSVWREEQAALHAKRVAAHVKAEAAFARANATAAAGAAIAGASLSAPSAAGAAAADVAKGSAHADKDRPPPHAPPEPAPLTVLEALSATGLRAVRYYKEIDGLDRVVANDMSADAVASIRRNVRYNGLDPDREVVPNEDDAISLMYRHREKTDRFAVVDLDPYGSAGPFLDSAVQAVEDGGLLCVTCTDMAVLAGNHGEACFAKYGAMSVRSAHCKEMAVRIILYVASHSLFISVSHVSSSSAPMHTFPLCRFFLSFSLFSTLFFHSFSFHFILPWPVVSVFDFSRSQIAFHSFVLDSAAVPTHVRCAHACPLCPRMSAVPTHIRCAHTCPHIYLAAQRSSILRHRYSISSAAARFKRHIVPVMSTSIDFYCRVFVRVHTSAVEVKRLASKMSMLYNCTGCHAFHLQPLGRVEEEGKSVKYKPAVGPVVGPKCDECDGSFHVGGPLWNGPIHDRAFVEAVLDGVRESPGK
jgi:tRNA G26 N,N-dimethylase Trm1